MNNYFIRRRVRIAYRRYQKEGRRVPSSLIGDLLKR
jgi:hypothetical protein